MLANLAFLAAVSGLSIAPWDIYDDFSDLENHADDLSANQYVFVADDEEDTQYIVTQAGSHIAVLFEHSVTFGWNYQADNVDGNINPEKIGVLNAYQVDDE